MLCYAPSNPSTRQLTSWWPRAINIPRTATAAPHIATRRDARSPSSLAATRLRRITRAVLSTARGDAAPSAYASCTPAPPEASTSLLRRG
eukprot:1572848-Pyramimonas_sp.AAC.1